MFFADLAEAHQSLEPDERDGFVIVTAARDQAMIYIMTGSHWCLRLSMRGNG
ncbi:hypothetical protein PSYAR_11229 [Pseudomonas syringae pv. aceris str. M302273]|nr:hypothetical protein PSYAR_11229 [Pseudomonas syringae pv. aceris str. M302273]